MSKKVPTNKVKKIVDVTFPHIDMDNLSLLSLQLKQDPYHDDVDDKDNTLPDDRLRRRGSPYTFSVKTLCAAVQNGCSVEAIKWYIQSYQTSSTRKILWDEGWPALYYAAERNSGEMVKLLIQAGVDASNAKIAYPVPLIGYVVIHGHIDAVDASAVLKVLLAAGYDPTSIPMDMWLNFLDDPEQTLNPTVKIPEAVKPNSAWCTPILRSILARSLHLTYRYLLHLAYGLSNIRLRKAQIAAANKMTGLTKLPFFLIGQRGAAAIVMDRVYSHISLDDQLPLVMAFSGASGYGKTELATAMGDLLSVNSTIIDMASCRNAWGLFGATAGYDRSTDGTKLNNFLAANGGKRSVVFLDEFDKTGQETRDALLLLAQSGTSPPSIPLSKILAKIK